MRKLFARCTALPALIALLVGACFVACTGGEGASPNCSQDVGKDGNTHLSDGCNPFAACRENPLDEHSKILPAEECCKDKDGTPFQGQLLKICLYGYGETVEGLSSTVASSGGGSDGAGGGK
jgi:hypothetical protein